jgi:predicted small lipoprotein YifL
MKKVMMIFGVILFTSMVLTSCGNSGYDLSSPESTMNTLFKASSEKDKEGLSVCFSKQSSEFETIVNKTLTDKDLNDLKEMFENAKIKSSKIEGSSASVSIQLTNRDEEISMAKENENWVILDF